MAALQIAVCLSVCLAVSWGMPAGKPDEDGLEKLKNSIADLKQLGSTVKADAPAIPAAISLSATEPAIKVDEIKTPSLDELIAKQKTPEVSSTTSLDDVLAKLKTPTEEVKSTPSFDELVAKHKATLTDAAPFAVGLSASDKPAATSSSFDLDAAIARIKAPSMDSISVPAAAAPASSGSSLGDFQANWESLMAKSSPTLSSTSNIMDTITAISAPKTSSLSLDEMLAKHKASNEELSHTPVLDEIMAKQKSESSLDSLKATLSSSTPTLDAITNLNTDSSSAVGGMSFDEIKASIAKSTSSTPTLDALKASLAKKAAQVAN